MKTSEEIRNYFLRDLRTILLRPSMFVVCEADLEMQISTIMGHLDFIEDRDPATIRPLRDELDEEGCWYPDNVIAGVKNVFRNIMPDIKEQRQMMNEIASVYARKAYQNGYLKLDNILSINEFESLKESIFVGDFSQGHTFESLLATLPKPSLVIHKILCFASEDKDMGWVYFDCPMINSEETQWHPLRSVRWPAASFEDGFELTKEGYEQTRRGIAKPEVDVNGFFKEWQNGAKLEPGQCMPLKKQNPRSSRWQHLW